MPKKSKKSKKAKKSKPKKAKIDPIPKGFGTVTPYLSMDRAAEALEWYKKAFGAKEIDRETVPGGKIMHARIRIGDSIIMLSDVFPGADTQAPSVLGNTTTTMHVYTKNVDKLWQQAVDAGAKVSIPARKNRLPWPNSNRNYRLVFYHVGNWLFACRFR